MVDLMAVLVAVSTNNSTQLGRERPDKRATKGALVVQINRALVLQVH